ncbi:DUF3040 domain-containing protein [Prauserella endophytica]|uniref:DUF3040 domain-containing protein n=1 Tax=Prauserella endophytica TaxID=1592324 RepID=A0ABY2S830_9PSEU|nr:DUF3040 domain-containing protein [Prauserella endophytica]TKG71838.1 DUF3040 domain-containing protein [Prauserella endophytica]
MLSHYERQELERIAQRFEHDDPELASALGSCAHPRGTLRLSKLARLGLDLFAGVLVVLGALTLNFGLVFVGALLLICAACAHLKGWSPIDPPPTQYRRME